MLLRRGKKPTIGIFPLLLSALGTVGLIMTAWYGGHMVYEQGMRVKGVSPVEDAPEIKPPGDEKLEEAFTELEKRLAPEDGSQG